MGEAQEENSPKMGGKEGSKTEMERVDVKCVLLDIGKSLCRPSESGMSETTRSSLPPCRRHHLPHLLRQRDTGRFHALFALQISVTSFKRCTKPSSSPTPSAPSPPSSPPNGTPQPSHPTATPSPLKPGPPQKRCRPTSSS